MHTPSLMQNLFSLVMVLLVRAATAIYAPCEPDEVPPYCTVFNHLVKSGGTTIKNELYGQARHLGDKRPGLCIGDKHGEDECATSLYHTCVVTGYVEIARNTLSDVGRSCDFFTMMRHPIDRLLSAFYYCPTDHDVQRRPRKYCGDAVDEGPAAERLIEFARYSWQNRAMAQMQFSFSCPAFSKICGDVKHEVSHDLNTELGQQTLQQVKDILSSYKAVGVMEHWDLSMELFNAAIVSSVEDWTASIRSNAGPESREREALLQWAHESSELHHMLAADLELYQHALTIFREQTKYYLGVER